MPRLLCAAPGYLAKHGEPRDPSALRSHRCLHYGYQQSGTSWRLQGPDGERSVQVSCALWSNNGEVLMDAALAGQGIALLPQFIVGPALADGRLAQVLSAYHAPDVSLCALYPRHRHLSTKIRLFVALLERRFGSGR
jgi:DNA-binding transcriptional LysR family regulator